MVVGIDEVSDRVVFYVIFFNVGSNLSSCGTRFVMSSLVACC